VYYEYDGLGRLKYIRDLDGNIVEGYDYNYRIDVPYQDPNTGK
jgi:hypothetical protein